MTTSLFLINDRHRVVPINPAPPVTKIRLPCRTRAGCAGSVLLAALRSFCIFTPLILGVTIAVGQTTWAGGKRDDGSIDSSGQQRLSHGSGSEAGALQVTAIRIPLNGPQVEL